MRSRVKWRTWGLLLAVLPNAAAAQPRATDRSTTSSLEQLPSYLSDNSIRGRSSTVRAQRWLMADEPALREKALKRLGIQSDAQGLELLIRAVQPDGQAHTPRLRLVALRSLARFLDDVTVRRALVTLMSGAGQPPEAADDPLEVLVRQSAAMALAASGHTDALIVLGKSLRQGGPTGQAAAQALTAYPPENLKALLTTRGAASTHLIDVLGALHDQRAFHALRGYITHGSPQVRARATVVLTQMGHMETVGLARHWLESARLEPSQQLAATSVLAMTRSDDSAKYLAKLLENEQLTPEAIRIAFEMPNPEYVPALAQAFPNVAASDKPLLLAAVGRAGGAAAVELLQAQLAKGAYVQEAAYALASAPSVTAEDALAAGLAQPKLRRLCARALVMRALTTGQQAAPLMDVLGSLLTAADPSDRAAGAFGLSALRPSETPALIASAHREVVLAAARNAHHGVAAVAAATRLATESDADLSLALSNSLADEAAQDLVPSARLHSLIQTGSAAASLAARALGARMAGVNQHLAEQLLANPSPQIRAEYAFGLGRAPAPSAMGLLGRAYEFETEAVVRRAIIAAASLRNEHPRQRLIDLASRLDPDTQVRQLARLARSGHRLSSAARAGQTFWLVLGNNAPRKPPALDRQPVVVQSTRGQTLVAFADPDGFIGLTGMDAGAVSYVLAEPAR